MNSLVQCVVARCLARPEVLAEALEDGLAFARAEGRSLDEVRAIEAIDFRVLRDILGQIVRVRHSALRPLLPATMTMLRLKKCELDVFSGFAMQRKEFARLPSSEIASRVSDFSQYLHSLANESSSVSMKLIRDVARHESVLAKQSLVGNSSLPLQHPRSETIGQEWNWGSLIAQSATSCVETYDYDAPRVARLDEPALDLKQASRSRSADVWAPVQVAASPS